MNRLFGLLLIFLFYTIDIPCQSIYSDSVIRIEVSYNCLDSSIEVKYSNNANKMLLLNANRIEVLLVDSSIYIYHKIVPQQAPLIGERSGFIFYHEMIFGEPYYLKEKLFLPTDVLQKGIKVRFTFEYIETHKVPRYDNLNPKLHRLLFPKRMKYIRIRVIKKVQAIQCVKYMPENKVIKFCQE